MPAKFLPSKPTRPSFQVSSAGGHSGSKITLKTPKISSSSLSSARR